MIIRHEKREISVKLKPIEIGIEVGNVRCLSSGF